MKQIKTYILFLFLFLVQFNSISLAETDWENTLRKQLMNEKSCEVKFLSRIRKYEILGRSIIDGRAHCKDEYLYDFIYEPEKNTFKITRCKTNVC